jgi:hypothetical protein
MVESEAGFGGMGQEVGFISHELRTISTHVCTAKSKLCILWIRLYTKLQFGRQPSDVLKEEHKAPFVSNLNILR